MTAPRNRRWCAPQSHEQNATAELPMKHKDVVRAVHQAELKLETFPLTQYRTIAMSADRVRDARQSAFYW
jgi:hypothetical protein